jgi:Rhodopirellula transposase DDE domain
VNVGTDHDTPVLEVTSIEAWWRRVAQKRHPEAAEIFITADAGGSNGYRARVWKFELQRLADKLGLPIRVSHFPPGTSKWNKVEHRLFSFITMNWRGKPLRTYETVHPRPIAL